MQIVMIIIMVVVSVVVTMKDGNSHRTKENTTATIIIFPRNVVTFLHESLLR